MRKSIVVVGVFVLASVLGFQICSAQLIDYNRRNRNAPKDTAPQPAPAAPAAASKPAAPKEEAKRPPLDTNAVLKDAVAAVYKKGSAKVNSAILKKYDKNKDGMISKAEAKAIEADIR